MIMRAGRMRAGCCWLLGLLLVLSSASIFGLPAARAQTAPNTVFIIQIRNQIDLGLAPFLARALQQAAAEDVRAVILEINTPGGRLDAALQMRDAILAAPVRTIAFINREAFSAGALIALAADAIYMAPGAVMGAATPVDGGGAAADGKTISAVRATFKSTAETRKRDPLVAEAMVDPAIEIAGLVERGQLLTLTAAQAQAAGYANGLVADRAELLGAADLGTATIQELTPGLAENVVRFLTNPLVASLLISLGFLLMLVDLYSGGFGLFGGAGLLLLAAFFWGHFLAGLAGWEGVALVVLGLALLALEVFVIPGFGIAGLLGAGALLGGLFVSLIGGAIVTSADLQRAAYTVAIACALMVAGGALALKALPASARFQGLVLQSTVGNAETEDRSAPPRWRWLEGERLAAVERDSLRGARGVTLSDLRPGGFARIGDARVDVVTRGDFIGAGELIEVIADEGYRRVVRRVEQDGGVTTGEYGTAPE